MIGLPTTSPAFVSLKTLLNVYELKLLAPEPKVSNARKLSSLRPFCKSLEQLQDIQSIMMLQQQIVSKRHSFDAYIRAKQAEYSQVAA